MQPEEVEVPWVLWSYRLFHPSLSCVFFFFFLCTNICWTPLYTYFFALWKYKSFIDKSLHSTLHLVLYVKSIIHGHLFFQILSTYYVEDTGPGARDARGYAQNLEEGKSLGSTTSLLPTNSMPPNFRGLSWGNGGGLGLLDKAVPKEVGMDGRRFLGTFCPFIVVSIWQGAQSWGNETGRQGTIRKTEIFWRGETAYLFKNNGKTL